MKLKVVHKIFMASGTALLIAGPVLLALMIGVWLDGFFQTSPVFSLIGGMLGFVGSIVSLLKILKT